MAERDDGLGLPEFSGWLRELQEQPAWRARADRESDYYDGNQLDADILRRQREIGIPPAIEPLIGPTIDAVLGAEAKSRTDWRVTADHDREGVDVAEALNQRLNQAERQARADDACSAAYASQVKVGVGWVEVAREADPFRFPYRCLAIHRNEIWWDFLAREPDLSDARYLIRSKWMQIGQAALLFPQHAGLIRSAGMGGHALDLANLGTEGGASTDLAMSWNMARGWSIEEQEWRDCANQRVCLFECWYRQWERVLVLKLGDGRVVEYAPDNEAHQVAVALGGVVPEYAVVSRVRLSWWLGPHRLSDAASPYRHRHFPYVPFWGKREDRTRAPYGLIRGMMFLQDEVNARISKMHWGLAATRTTRTEGAVKDDDTTFRREVARPDADIVLDHDRMREGGVFKVERDFQLNQQQYQRLADAREGIKRTGGVYNAFMGQDGQAKSGVAIAGLVEQSNQTLADLNDNAAYARSQVGELLLSMIIEDLIGKPDEVFIDGEGIRDDKRISLNTPRTDPATGVRYLDNDIERIRLKVGMEDVPSTPTFRAQQLGAMSEAFKSMPREYQRVMFPHLLALMDVPNQRAIIEAIQQADQQQTPDQVQQAIEMQVQRALKDAQYDLKLRELDQRQPLIDAQVRRTRHEAAGKGVESLVRATQAAASVASQPGIALLADELLEAAGSDVDADAPLAPVAVERGIEGGALGAP
ncbi:portal protein [Chitiniphilus eburneus]|uniref:Portal protein n=1 Tax=Chitiniphilus eburneus TaxID=2571148 RepID=A0A4U0PUS1_9NEIS|nr:hypothetical protein [Chitiniphilus eburneus]TJZ66814.1 hypothetical protein FAZ21_16650 [Chitiniphilus eburneus]